MAENTRYRRIRDICDQLGEGPVWSGVEQKLYWIDWKRRLIRRCNPNHGPIEEWQMPETVAGVLPGIDGNTVVALGSGLYGWDPISNTLELYAATHVGESGIELNDCRCDPAGRVWAGSYDLAQSEDRAALFSFSHHEGLKRFDLGLVVVNGIAFSPDARKLVISDSGTRQLLVFDYDVSKGELGSRRVLAEIDPPGVPHGSTFDAEGFLWNAQFYGSRLVRYALDGRVDRVIETPMSQPSACTFGGPNLESLFVTSARWKMTPEQEKREELAGALLSIEVGVGGVPEPLVYRRAILGLT